MTCRGIHFILSAKDEERVASADDDEVLELLERLEEEWDKDNLAESDKAWDAIHRTLTDGELLYDNGEYPLNHVICGSRRVYSGDDYTICLTTPSQVIDIANALNVITKQWFTERYFSLLPNNGYEHDISQEDLDYTYNWLQSIVKLFDKAAKLQRAVLFSVDA